jgi:hypothetical protein
MKEFVQRIIMEYTNYLHDKEMYERHLEMRENYDMREALTVVDIRIGVVECLFGLLDSQEKFAFRQALQGTQNETAAMQSAAITWMWRLTMDERTPWQAREQAVQEITNFTSRYMDIMLAVFGDS